MRNSTLSILKGIGIILMVIGHAEAPELITNFIYTFHMPLFFMAAGYFFSRKYLAQPWNFISRRVKGLYFPFVKWSVVFLLLHNVWHHFGILNEEYGNWTGGVTHPYSPHDMIQRLVMIVTGMNGYDEFMAGAFWFFRGLLVASVAFLLLYKLLDSHTRMGETPALLVICCAMVALTGLHIATGFSIRTIPNGGWRETWGIFFFSAGVLFRKYESRISGRWYITLLCLAFLIFAATRHFSGMNNGGKMRDLWTLPLTGTAGFLMTHHLSMLIDLMGGWVKRLLVYIGNNTLYVFIFHIIAYKPVSLMKIAWYDLDPAQIGCHMVIHYNNTDFFWVIYSVAGTALPLIGSAACRRVAGAWRNKKAEAGTDLNQA